MADAGWVWRRQIADRDEVSSRAMDASHVVDADKDPGHLAGMGNMIEDTVVEVFQQLVVDSSLGSDTACAGVDKDAAAGGIAEATVVVVDNVDTGDTAGVIAEQAIPELESR